MDPRQYLYPDQRRPPTTPPPPEVAGLWPSAPSPAATAATEEGQRVFGRNVTNRCADGARAHKAVRGVEPARAATPPPLPPPPLEDIAAWTPQRGSSSLRPHLQSESTAAGSRPPRRPRAWGAVSGAMGDGPDGARKWRRHEREAAAPGEAERRSHFMTPISSALLLEKDVAVDRSSRFQEPPRLCMAAEETLAQLQHLIAAGTTNEEEEEGGMDADITIDSLEDVSPIAHLNDDGSSSHIQADLPRVAAAVGEDDEEMPAELRSLFIRSEALQLFRDTCSSALL